MAIIDRIYYFHPDTALSCGIGLGAYKGEWAVPQATELRQEHQGQGILCLGDLGVTGEGCTSRCCRTAWRGWRREDKHCGLYLMGINVVAGLHDEVVA
jgi:hypothetical protein